MDDINRKSHYMNMGSNENEKGSIEGISKEKLLSYFISES